MKNRLKIFIFMFIFIGCIIIITPFQTFSEATSSMNNENEIITNESTAKDISKDISKDIVSDFVNDASKDTHLDASKDTHLDTSENTTKDVSKNTTKDTLIQILKSELPEGSLITASYIDDFNKDNKLEMFSIVNTGKDNAEEYFDDQLWYSDEAIAKNIFEGGLYPNTATVWDIGKQKLFYIEEGYGGSGSLSRVWSVKDSQPYELDIAGETLEYAGDLQFYIYPGAFDLMTNGTGHTWKRYYLYFDEVTGTFKEYGGISISEKDLLKLNGTSEILNDLRNKGYKISDILYRENGVININYSDGKYNLNLTLTIKDSSVILWSSIENPDYDQSGIYKAAISEDIATYPEKFIY